MSVPKSTIPLKLFVFPLYPIKLCDKWTCQDQNVIKAPFVDKCSSNSVPTRVKQEKEMQMVDEVMIYLPL